MTQTRAGLGRRFAAAALDFIIVPVGTLVLVWIAGALEHADDYVGNRILYQVLAWGVVSYLLINGLLLFTRAQTLGKAAFGLTVLTDGDGRPAGFVRLLLRALFFPLVYLLFLPPFLLLPLLDLAFLLRKDRRALHDLICGTVVCERDREAKAD